jgi:hypothetical protein
MSVPLPTPDRINLQPPSAAEVLALSRGVVSAVADGGELSPLQQLLIGAVFRAMTDHDAVLDGAPMTPAEFAACLADRDFVFRSRIVQLMVLTALVVRPLPVAVADRIDRFARAVGVDDDMLHVVHELAEGSLDLAAIDFERNGYLTDWAADDGAALHMSTGRVGPWDVALHDRDLAARWGALETLPPGSLGRRITEFYQARGFAYPGLPGSAPPLLAQHDWVHVLADFGTTVESELEVFAFIARANDDPHAFSLLAMVISLFETGYLSRAAGLFESDAGHLEREGVAVRVADAMRRGARCQGSIDFLRVDWFSIAALDLEAAREHFGVTAKAPGALAAGSVGPWEPGGISAFQAAAGRTHAETEGRAYDAFGASVA